MEDIVRYETISQYNADMNHETLHPLVTVVDFSKAPAQALPKEHYFGFYTIFLKEVFTLFIKIPDDHIQSLQGHTPDKHNQIMGVPTHLHHHYARLSKLDSSQRYQRALHN